MKNYNKPVVEVMPELAEGVYLDQSGDKHPEKCRFGRSEANAGADACQFCSLSGGTQSTGPEGTGKDAYTVCPDNMPEKQ